MSAPLTSQGRLWQLALSCGDCPQGGSHSWVYFKEAKQWTCIKCKSSRR
ncbi:hypothetical protein [Tenggerimyces flavus]|uniref:Uncharacterized protein n=1 Tax=Tenggerimyces flavus TaxID=1708749 RepID=A0ABV7YCZ4_9ACTN|nr:hypothetical protein [Tenggerimyces flavus]MBM7788899.1 hypothetical protein [Tenggerimyces flavus]